MTPALPGFRKVVASRLYLAWTHRTTLASFAILIFLYNLLYLVPSTIDARSIKLESSVSKICDDRVASGQIPNYVHFVYILEEHDQDFGFQFKHFLSMYAASYYWKPDLIYLHTNADAGGQAVSRAREGQAGIWSKRIFTTFENLRINTVEAPTHTIMGMEIQGLEHRSDFVRVKAVHGIGGVYIDFDVYALRDIRILRESGFKAIAGRQFGGQVNSGVFMSVKAGKLLELWMYSMDEAYDGGWTTHSNKLVTKFGERLVREPGEMLIMDRDAFAPGSWEDEDTDILFAPHDDVISNPSNDMEVSSLSTYEESFDERWTAPQDFPIWARDWSSSYLLHAFTPDRWGHEIEGFTHITPRYVLERKSNFARAVYPIARQMYEDGLIDVSDSYDGL